MTVPYANVRLDMSKLEKALRDLDERSRAIGIESIVTETIITNIADLIDSQGNGQWPGFSPLTLILHPRRVGGMLLQHTKQLASIQAVTWPGFAVAYSPAPYAWYHQEGTSRLRGWVHSDDHGTPARDFMDIDLPATLEEVCQIVVNEVVA